MTEQYPNYEPSWPLQVFGQLYHDQGMKKWGGFYLSDHTAARQRETETAAAVAARQRHAQMNLSDMMALAQLAIEKQLSVTAQSNTATYNLAGDLVLPPAHPGPHYRLHHTTSPNCTNNLSLGGHALVGYT